TDRTAAVDPEHAALTYFREHLALKSASSLRHAVRAARADFAARAKTKIAKIERLYLDELMSTRDAVEGLQAFIAKRPAQWMHRCIDRPRPGSSRARKRCSRICRSRRRGNGRRSNPVARSSA